MAIRILFDNNHIPRTPTFVLANRNGNKLGIIPAININLSDHLNDASEIQFRVQRDMDGSRVELWDDIVDFKLIWCPEWDQWFEISVEVNDGDSVSKSVAGKALGEAELSQIYLYNIEINTESDISQADYVVTVLYDENNPKGSLLDRIMEKAPHYSIGHVDSSIANLQRTFSFDGTTILDAFNEIAEEMDCLFVIDSGSKPDGSISRTVNVYDMEAVCRNCGFRGVFSGPCPDCGSEDVRYGYGEDTNIYVSSENLTDEITYTSNVDSVKNYFRLVGGDDLMTATIANCNPNGSGYLWYFSDAMRSDMSDTLKARLTAYDNEYADYSSSHAFAIPSSMVTRYNALVTKYRPYRSTLNTISTTVTGYSALMNLFYDTIDFDMLLRNELMPSVEISTKTAATEAARLTAERLSPTAVVSLENISEATASSAVLALAKQTVDGNFQVKVNNSSLSGTTWTGNFKVTNYSDDEDTATSSMISVTLTDDQETYLEQRINKILADGDKEIVDISDLFKASQSTFENEIKKYCLNSLNSMRDICQSCMDLLIENGVADEDKWATAETDLYTVIYLPFYNKYNALVSEVALRESEIATVTGKFDENGGIIEDGLQTIVIRHNSEAQEHLDFEAYLGTELMKELAAYRREDTYENSNFISDGLSNQEVFARALEFIELAKKEIYKSATLQHSITSNLKNLLVMREFASLTNQFEVGNWLSVGVDNKVYRLRLVTYEIDFDRIEEINVEFSDVVETPSGASDIESILSSASSMATSFGSVKRQAKRGDQSHATLTDYMERGLSLTNMKIVSSADNQNVTIDQHGVLCREAVPYNEDYDERQLKIINRGLYLTKDGWRTSTAGIGDFIYYDPEDGEMKQDYGVVADVLMGNYILGEKFGIYNENSTVKIDKNGLTIIAQPESEEDAGNETVFRVQRAVDGGDPENVIWFDADGHAHFSGDFTLSSTIGNKTLGQLIGQVDIEFCENQSRTVPPDEDDSGWTTDAPEWRDGYYIWQRTTTTTAGGAPVHSDPICISVRDGDNGTNTATIMLYRRTNAQTVDKPSVSGAEYATYTFASKTLSPTPNNWSMSIPAGDEPCWVSAATAVSTTATDRIYNSEWTTPVKMLQNGTDGLNQATIMLYQRASSIPSKPAANATYTFATGVLSPVPEGWSRSIPNGTDPCYVTSAVAISTSATDTIIGTPSASNEWADVTKMVEDGASASVYELVCSPSSLVRDTDGTLQPQSVVLSSTRAEGNGTPSAYSGRFKIEEYDGESWSIPAKYISSVDESSKTYSPTNTAKLIRATLYEAGGTITQLDTQSIPIVSDGVGADAYTVLLSNESHTFAASATAAISGGTTTSQVIAYKGRTQIGATIGSITGAPNGMTVVVDSNSNGTTGAYFTVNVTSNLEQAQGVLTVPVTVDSGISFSLKFSWSLAFTGKGTSAIEEQYLIAPVSYNATGEEPEGTGYNKWSTEQPVWESGYSIWTRTKITWTSGSPRITYTDPILAKAINSANQAVEDLDISLDQQEVYDRLTNYSQNEGIYLEDGRLYVNASMLHAGIIDGTMVKTKLLKIYDGNGIADSNIIAQFNGDKITLGYTADSHAELDGNSFELLDRSGQLFFSVGDARDGNGQYTVTEQFISNGVSYDYYMGAQCSSFLGLTVDGEDVSTSAYTISETRITFSTPPVRGSVIVARYITTQPAYYYTIGKRENNSPQGIYSVAEGDSVVASGRASHAEGSSTIASGGSSHAEGGGTTASGLYSHAEGQGTIAMLGQGAHSEGFVTTASNTGAHAEGWGTNASGQAAHAEGANTVASGLYSHAEGYGTIASGPYSHVFGIYNIDVAGKIEIVGNGNSDSSRSNARTLDGNGNETLAGNLTTGGNINVEKSDPAVCVKNTSKSDIDIKLQINGNGRQGLHTNGYIDYNGNFVSSAGWMMNRNGDGKIYLDVDDVVVSNNLLLPNNPLGIQYGGTGATSAAGALASIGARANAQPTTGAWFNGTPIISSDGVMEVGRYIDFHTSNTSTGDYDFRISVSTSNGVTNLSMTNPLTISNGGTGATTKANARANLGVYSTSEVYTKSEVDSMLSSQTFSGTLDVAHGGTGHSGFTTTGRVLLTNGNNALSSREIVNNTSATTVTASTSLVTANTLYYHTQAFTGSSNISTVGTITSGTWNGTAIGASYIGNHSTSKLTSGTLGTARGGTGVSLSASPSMLVDLGSTSSADVFATSPRPGVTGTLAVGNGGTGATSAADARTNLNVYSKTDVYTKSEIVSTATANQLVDSSKKVYFKRSGNIVVANVEPIATRTIAAWGSVNIASIPTGFAADFGSCMVLPIQSGTSYIPVFVRANGNYIYLQNQSNNSITTGAIMQFSFVYSAAM